MAPRRRAAAELGIDYRPVGQADLAFLAELYVAGRLDELEPTDWPIETKRTFLRQQHQFRDRQYRARFPEMEALVITRDGRDIGHLALSESANAIRLVDVALSADARGQGIGAAILADLIAEARGSGRTIELRVEAGNRARRLYERKGFRVVREGSLDVEMAWSEDQQRDQ